MTQRRLTWDETKRQRTIAERGIDFADIDDVLDDPQAARVQDTRQNYGETRMIVFGRLRGRLLVVVYTERGDATHIISARKANEREQRRFYGQ